MKGKHSQTLADLSCDLCSTVKRIPNGIDQQAAVTQAAKYAGRGNGFLLFKVVLDRVAYGSITELQPRWINRFAGVDVWLKSHVRTAILYVRWNDKDGSSQPAKSE